jgi:hypothetical protein
MSYELTQHARTALEARSIPFEWLERALQEPELKLPDPTDTTLERRYRKIPEHGNRVLRNFLHLARLPTEPVRIPNGK